MYHYVACTWWMHVLPHQPLHQLLAPNHVLNEEDNYTEIQVTGNVMSQTIVKHVTGHSEM